MQLIFIDFPLDQAAFNASKVLNCIDQEKQIDFLDTVYEDQNKWTSGSEINEFNNNLKKIAKNLGISASQFDKCLNDEVISDKILTGRIDVQKKYLSVQQALGGLEVSRIRMEQQLDATLKAKDELRVKFTEIQQEEQEPARQE